MLFQKSAPHVGRSALKATAKSHKFWATSTAQGQNPSFFVSTPQFNRHQQSQLQAQLDDHRSGADAHLEHSYLPLTAGGPVLNAHEEDERVNARARRGTIGGSTRTRSAPGLPPSVRSRPRPRQRIRATTVATTTTTPHRTPTPRGTATAGSTNSTGTATSSISTTSSSTSSTASNSNSSSNSSSTTTTRSSSISSTTSTTSSTTSISSSSTIEKQPLPSNKLAEHNELLRSLRVAGVAAQLQAYERMLAGGIIPNDETYTIVTSSLVEAAEALNDQRRSLSPLLGPPSLESVAEVYEGLGVEEHLVLAQQILAAVLHARNFAVSPELMLCVRRVLDCCVSNNVQPNSDLLRACPILPPAQAIASQSSIGLAASEFEALPPSEQRSESAQSAMLASYFRFKHPQGAVLFYANCGAPRYLLKQLLRGFAGNGYVATARRWISSTANTASNSNDSVKLIADVLEAIPLEKAAIALPSATRMFYHAAARSANNETNGDVRWRSAYLRLCAAAQHKPALLMAIRESKLRDASWNAAAIQEVVKFLASEPLLAADICRWQTGKQLSAHAEMGLKSYVAQELVSETVRAIEDHPQFSSAAVRLLPVVNCLTNSRVTVLASLSGASVKGSEAVSAAYDLAELMLSTKLSRIELQHAKAGFRQFVSAASGASAKVEQLLLIKRAAKLVDPEITINITIEPNEDSEVSMLIQRYAQVSVDHGVDLLLSALRLKQQVTQFAVKAVLASCVHTNGKSRPELLNVVAGALKPTSTNLNLLTIAAAESQQFELAEESYLKLKSESLASVWEETFEHLIRLFALQPSKAIDLLQDAKQVGKASKPIYELAVLSLARARRATEACALLSHLDTNSVSPVVFEELICMHAANGDGNSGMKLLQQLNPDVKALVGVRAYNALMSHFVHVAPSRALALEVFGELQRVGTLATPKTYTLLMEAYLLKADGEEPSMQHADKVLLLMKRDGAPISTQCFATLLRARGVLMKDLDGARDFYRGLVKSSRVLPDKGIFKALIESYTSNGMRADPVYEEMKRYHIPLDAEMRALAVQCE